MSWKANVRLTEDLFLRSPPAKSRLLSRETGAIGLHFAGCWRQL
jgi:hypothetical protein